LTKNNQISQHNVAFCGKKKDYCEKLHKEKGNFGMVYSNFTYAQKSKIL